MEFDKNPAPEANQHPACWDMVDRDLEKGVDGSLPLVDVYMDIMGLASKIIVLNELEKGNTSITLEEAIQKISSYGLDRDKFGFDKYGVRLQPFNGRNFMVDCVEEVLDLLVYFRGKMYEVQEQKREKQE